MQRRTFITALATLPFIRPALAEIPEHEIKLISSGADSKDLVYGLHVKLAKGWKTYWAVPGEAGIPPLIKIEGKDIEGFTVQYPTPIRIIDGSGESIGYHDEVVFILRPTTTALINRAHVEGKISAFMGVCQIICKPVKFEADLSSAVRNDVLLKKYMAQVPTQSTFVSKATQNADQIEITLSLPVDDLFVDGPSNLYLRKPALSQGKATLKIDGLTEGQKLTGEKLRITAVVGGKGLEQTITIS